MIAATFVLGLVAIAQARPQPQTTGTNHVNGSITGNGSYVLPLYDPNPAARAAELERNRAGFLYGPSLIGNSSFFLTGPLGDQLVQSDIDLWNSDAGPVRSTIQAEAAPVLETLGAVSC